LVDLLENARRVSARAVNTIMTATYWEVGRRIVDFEQGGKKRAGYGEALLERLAADLIAKVWAWFFAAKPAEVPPVLFGLPGNSPHTVGGNPARRNAPHCRGNPWC
jgi:hypothetical protein